MSVFFVLLEGVSTFGEVTFNPVPVLLSSLGKLLSTGRFIELELLLQLLLLHEEVRGPTSPRPEIKLRFNSIMHNYIIIFQNTKIKSTQKDWRTDVP